MINISLRLNLHVISLKEKYIEIYMYYISKLIIACSYVVPHLVFLHFNETQASLMQHNFDIRYSLYHVIMS